MDELFEELGLDPDAPVAQAVEKVKTISATIQDKNNIIEGLQNKVESLEDQIDSIADGVAEARVKDLVQKVQNETGRHVGKDHMDTLQKKAAQHLYANENEKDSIWEDMKAHTIAYGTKVGMSDKIDALSGDRDKGDTEEDRRYNKAKRLVDSGEADSWEEAHDMVMEEENKKSAKEE